MNGSITPTNNLGQFDVWTFHAYYGAATLGLSENGTSGHGMPCLTKNAAMTLRSGRMTPGAIVFWHGPDFSNRRRCFFGVMAEEALPIRRLFSQAVLPMKASDGKAT